MRSTLSILFYIKAKETDKDNKAPILARITIDSKRAQFNTKCKVNPKEWDSKNNKVQGRSASAQNINNKLEDIRSALNQHYWTITNTELMVTAEKVKNAFLGLNLRQETLLQMFEVYNNDLKAQLGKGVGKDTYEKYERTRKRLEAFLKYKYNISDIFMREINLSFLNDFEIYLKTIHSCGQNTTLKFMQRVKTIVLIAFSNGWIKVNPFNRYKMVPEKTERDYLTEGEIKKIMTKKFPIKRLESVRDIFIFSCFTGLAYIDVQNLTTDNVRTLSDDTLWLIGKRIKTDVTYRVPLLEIPMKIIQKYESLLPNDLILPVISNQKMNAYLKEIADVCGIKKNLTFHVARHTFATTITLSQGVSIESVSKMLGHTNIRTTQIYARITDDKIANDMAMISSRINNSFL